MEKTKAIQKVKGVPNLYHRSGTYYARISVNGKRCWRSLDTDKIRQAKKALAEFQTGKIPVIRRRAEPTMHVALKATIDHRRARRSIGKPLSETTLTFHAELLACAKRLFPDHMLSSFSKDGILEAITSAKTQPQRANRSVT